MSHLEPEDAACERLDLSTLRVLAYSFSDPVQVHFPFSTETITMIRFLTLVAVIFGSTLARADDLAIPADSRIYTASDLAGGPFVTDYHASTYSFWVWTDGRVDWRDKNSQSDLQIESQAPTSSVKAHWIKLGERAVTLDNLPTITVETKAGGPIPALMAISTDPKFDPGRALDLIRGNVKTIDPPVDPRRTTIRTEYEGADFDPPASLEAWEDQANRLRERLRVTLGLWPEPPRTDMHPEVYGTTERDGYAVDKVVLETLPGVYLAGNLFRPTGSNHAANARHPVVLCPHGHAAEGRVDKDVQARCVRLARLGCVVFVYDMVGFADSKPFGHAWMTDRLKRWGLSLAGLQTWNSLRAVDYVTSRPDVDAARMAVTGESGGATQTILLTALEPRIKVAAPVVMVSDSYQGGCTCENAPGLRWGTDNVAIAALAAPRPLKLVGATGDWTARTMTNAYPTLQLVYGRYGASDRISASVFDFPHNYNRTSRDAVYDFFGHWLLGLPGDAVTQEPDDLKIETPADLFAYGATHPYPAQALSPEALEASSVARVAGQINRLTPGDDPLMWAAARERLDVAHRVRVAVEPPSPRDTNAKLVRAIDRPGFTVRHFTVSRRTDGGLIPVVWFEPKRSDRTRGALTVVSLDRGKVELVTASGEPSPLVQALLDQGESVVGFDPLLIGESVDPTLPATSRPAGDRFDAYNPSLALDRMRDLGTVVSWSAGLAGIVEVNLVGRGHAGVLALLARPRLSGIGRTVIDLDRFTYGDGSTPVPPDLDLPGLFQFGGLSGSAALIAPAPLWITGAGAEFDASWAKDAYGLAGATGQLRLERNATHETIARWVDSGEQP